MPRNCGRIDREFPDHRSLIKNRNPVSAGYRSIYAEEVGVNLSVRKAAVFAPVIHCVKMTDLAQME
jgi:hypothetical protein